MSNSSGTRQLQRLPGLNQLWQRLESIPRPEPENSILLRVLVQALVVVGIVATDIAAGVGEGEIPLSLWAVPLSIAGATWSWFHRRDRNVPMKFLLAIGMIGAMVFFFVRGLGSLNDMRLVLAELLIQLQVLHSFDLPRRKDLGYSMVIGLILLGVAATLSQTLAFAPLLLLFLAIGLPVLVLDYRSRLGIGTKPKTYLRGVPQTWQARLAAYGLSPKRLGVMFLAVVALGLAIFALVPRFPGYQLQTMLPVSAPNSLKDQDFPGNNLGIVRPGRRNQQGSGTGAGQGQGEDGKTEETSYYGFSSKMNQNQSGELKPKVVMRVRSQSEGFWRVLAFDNYTGQGWEISRDTQTRTLERPSWSYRFFLYLGGGGNRTKSVIQTYSVVSELPNLIPALALPRELYFPTLKVAVDTEGGLRSPQILPEGLTYTVISDVPYRDRDVLGQASTRYPKNIQKYYLQVPDAIAAKVRARTQEILAKYNQQQIDRKQKPLTSPYEKALYLAQYIKQNYKVPKEAMGLPLLGENEDLVSAFLFKNQGGYPDHFSTVLTIMLRSIGIPSRLVGGFAPGQFNPFTGLYIVSNTDAYAMTEVYFPKYGWFTFDPIPGHDLIPPSIEENQTFSVLQQFWKWVAGWLPSPLTGWLNGLFEAIASFLGMAISLLWGMLSNGWVGFFTACVLGIVLGFLGWLGWTQWKAWRRRAWLAKLPPMESVYQQMLDDLASQGFRKHPAQTPLEYAKASHQHHPQPISETIEEVSHAYVGWRYGKITPSNLQLLQQRVQQLRKLAAKQRSRA